MISPNTLNFCLYIYIREDSKKNDASLMLILIERYIEAFTARQNEALSEILSMEYDSRKALAEVVTKKECPACLFAIVDGKADSARNWLLSRSVEKILGYIGVIR